MKKVFDQTVRDIKREVNKKVLKVPGIEQKVLDITSNEPWGPHGSVMADIAQATRNFHEYQIIMGVLWKRLSDTGKNWRHVYKALTVLEYLVGHGSERVIDDLLEHAYQISTLKDFQYIDSRGKDQGQNVRKKSHTLVTLLSDKARIQEARQKASINKDRFQNRSSTGYKPGFNGGDQYDSDRYGSGYGGSGYGGRGKDRYGHGIESGEPYRDDVLGPERKNDYGQYGSKNDNGDNDSERGSSRTSDYSVSEDRYERRLSGNTGAPPSYEEAVNYSPQNNPVEGEKSELEVTTVKTTTQVGAKSEDQDVANSPANAMASTLKPVNDFDEFDPRNSFSAAAASASFSGSETDLFGLSAEPLAFSSPGGAPAQASVSETNLTADLFGGDAFASTPPGYDFHTNFATEIPSSGATPALPAADSQVQPGQNPFGDPPFKASFAGSEDTNEINSFDVASLSASALDVDSGQFHHIATSQPSFSVASSNAENLNFTDSFQSGSFNPFETDANPSILQPTATPPGQSSLLTDALHSQLPTFSIAQPPQDTEIQAKDEAHLPFANQMQSQTSHFPPNFSEPQAVSNVSSALPVPSSADVFQTHLPSQPITQPSQPQAFNNASIAPAVPGSSPADALQAQLLSHSIAQPSQPRAFYNASNTPPVPSFNPADAFQTQLPSHPATQPSQPQAFSNASNTPPLPSSTPGDAFQTQLPSRSVTHLSQPQAFHNASNTPTVPSSSPADAFQTQLPNHPITPSQPQAFNNASNTPAVLSSSPANAFQTQLQNYPITQPSPQTQMQAQQAQNQGKEINNDPQNRMQAQTSAFDSQMTSQTSASDFGFSQSQASTNASFPTAPVRISIPGADGFQTQLPSYPSAQTSQQTPDYSATQHSQQTQIQDKQVHAQVPNQSQQQTSSFDLDFTQPRASSIPLSTKPQEQIMPPISNVTSSLAMSSESSQAKNDKFEPKSGIWADTLSRGLVDLNISGPKINPLADIGIDFDSINRKEKRREEKPPAASISSANQPMGKAMGSGSGCGRAGGAMFGQTNPVVGAGRMGTGSYNLAMGAGARAGMGMGMGVGMGMGAAGGAGMGMNMGMGMNAGPGSVMGAAPGMGTSATPVMGNNFTVGMNPPMGMNPGIGGPGMGMRPPMTTQPGSGTGFGMGGYVGMGTGVNPTMNSPGMNPTASVFLSQQQPGYR